MIGWLVKDKSETGYYEQGHKVIRLLLTIVNSLGVVMVPKMANAFANNNKKQINSYMKMSFRFTFFLSFPIMLGIISISNIFVPLFFGSGYDKVNYIIYLLSHMILLMGIANVIGIQYLLPTKRQKAYTISVTCGVIVNFILNYILITLYQSIGAAIATVLSQLVVDVVQYNNIKGEIRMKELLNVCYKYFLSALIMFICCLGIKVLLTTTIIYDILYNLVLNSNKLFNIISITTQIIVGFIVYFVMLIILKDDYIFNFIDKIKSRLLKNKL